LRILFNILRHDFAPGWSRRIRPAVATPLGVLIIAAGVAILAGLVIHPRVFVLAGGLLTVAAFGICWPWITTRGLRGSLHFDRPRSVEGHEVGAKLTITNHLPWPLWSLHLRSLDSATIVRLPAMSARTVSECRWVYTPQRRGVYPVQLPKIATGFPFGVWESERAAEVDAPLIVWPRTYPVGPIPSCNSDTLLDGQVVRNKVGGSGDVLGVRPYRRGDSPRRIHWAQSARHDRLIVCELQATSRPVILLVLDLNDSAHTSGPDGTLENAIRVAASLVNGWLEAGAQVGLVASDTAMTPQSGLEHCTRILDTLAGIQTGVEELQTVLENHKIPTRHDVMSVIITTDRGAAHIQQVQPDSRWIILNSAGFGGDSTFTFTPRPWLLITGPNSLPDELRFGTLEAAHGS
jgi:uncharacterized protein (DUF58 family)